MCKDVCVRKIRLKMCFRISVATSVRKSARVLELSLTSLVSSDGLLESTPKGCPGPCGFL